MFEKGCIPWNKGMKGYINNGSFKKGQESSKAMLGRKASLETRRKMSESSKNSINSGRFKKGIIPLSKSNPDMMPKGKDHWHWQGGKAKTVGGYIWLWCKGHPAANNNYVYEHRLVIELHLQRELVKGEVIHHVNEIRNDNRIENLILFASNGSHIRFHHHPDRVSPDQILFDGRLLNTTSAEL